MRKFVIVFFLAVVFLTQNAAQAQPDCPSGIKLNVASGNDMIAIWSPLSNGDYHITRGWNVGEHTQKDIYSLDLNMAGTADLGKAVYLPMTGRVWTAFKSGTSTSPNYGNTVLVWDPGSGIVIRLAHLQSVASPVYFAGAGSWVGAGAKAGYIGESGCPGCGSHLHMTAYRNVKVGVPYAGRTATEQDIIGFLSAGNTPTFAVAQKFRVLAPSDNCYLIQFNDNQTVYTYKNGALYPITFDVWRSWGLSLDLTPRSGGQYDSSAGRIPVNVLPSYQRSSYPTSNQLAPPRTDSVFRGYQYPDVYVYRWNQKNFLNASQFGDQPWHEYRWSEIQMMDQNFVDNLPPKTFR